MLLPLLQVGNAQECADTSSSHILSSHRARCSAQCVGDASVGRATEQGTNVLLSDRSQCGNSVVLCNAPAAAAGSAALEA